MTREEFEIQKPFEELAALDLVTSLELTHHSEKVKVTDDAGTTTEPTLKCYHFLYGSTLYGTTFNVYGQFDSIEIEGGAARKVTFLTMRILNYQGVLNIGFTDEHPPKYISSKQSIEFGVRGASTLDRTFLDLSNESLIVRKGKHFRLIFERMLVPLAGFSAIGDPTNRQPVPDQKAILFDTEFHYRNGVDHFPQLLRDGMKKPAPPIDDMAGGSPTGRCLTSTINLLYW